MNISVTERQSFKRCRRAWDYSSTNRQRLESIIPKPALGLGTLIHRTHAKWIICPECDPDQIFIDDAALEIERIKNRYKKRVGAMPNDEEMRDTIDSVVLGRAMLRNYKSYYGSPVPADMKAFANEQTLNVPVPGTNHRLVARMDTILQDNKGNLWIRDLKTYTHKQSDQDLQMNDQFLAYQWMLDSLGMGRVAGVLYDGMYKRAEPVRGKGLEDLFHRIRISRNSEELEEFGKFLQHEISDMVNNPILYTNRRWEGCTRDCQFLKLCIAESRDEDVDYIREHFYTSR